MILIYCSLVACRSQFRSALNEAKEEEGLASPPSPRKSASFPQLIPSNPSSPVVHQRELALELHCTLSHRDAIAKDVEGEAGAKIAARADLLLEDSDDDDDIAITVDSPVYSDAGSSSSSAYSPVTNEYKDEEIADVEDPVATTRNRSFSDELPDWLQVRPTTAEPTTPGSTTAAVDFAHTVQQIEADIRHALDSAASRVTQETERRDRFQQQLQDAASYDSSSTSTPIASSSDAEKPSAWTPPPAAGSELLLLMEVVIGEGRSETIEVHVGDKPDALAAQFAHTHALKADAVPKLTQLIQDQLDALNLDDLGFFETDPLPPTSANEPEPRYDQSRPQDPYQLPPPAPMMQHYDAETPLPPPPPTSAQRTSSFGVDNPRYALNRNEVEDQETDGRTAAADTDARWSDKSEREYSRAMNYQNLMAKYGHYSHHSGKVNPHAATPEISTSSKPGGARAASSDGTRASTSNDPLTFRNIQLAEHTRVIASLSSSSSRHRHTLHGASHSLSNPKQKKAPPAVFDRLYALAESKDKWIKRAQTAKQRELEREQDQRKVEMAAKSRELVAHRQHGGYVHIGERLYEEALSDMAKKDKRRAQRAAERDQEIDWMCPKCAFANQYHDEVCKNIVALTTTTAGSSSSSADRNVEESRIKARRESNGGGFMEPPEGICGQPKPEQLFRPTLLTTSTTTAAKQSALAKERTFASSSATRRQKHQQAMEDEFKQTCPFKPKINEVSAEIVRERLENEARSASALMGKSTTTTATTTTATGELRRKDPHLALYEESFHVRANRHAREEEYHRQYSYKPDIGVNSLWISGDRSQEDLVERLAVSKYHESETKRQALLEKYAPDRDPYSGREFFKPETGRAPLFNRNEKGLPIGDFLHESHREQQEYHRRLLQQDMQEIHQQAHQGFVSEASKQALAMRKKKTFHRIFDALVKASVAPSSNPPGGRDQLHASSLQDPSGMQEEDGKPAGLSSTPSLQRVPQSEELVTPSLVDLQKLPREIVSVVPIVFEFANHEPFGRDQFAAFMDKLMTEVPGLTYTQVLFLAEKLNDGKSSRPTSLVDKQQRSDADDDAAELTFRPAIDKNSSVIAKKHGRADRSKVFHALNQYFEHYKDRKEQIKKQHQREFERLHPFQPTFVTKNRKQQSDGFYDKIKRMEPEEGHGALTSEEAAQSVSRDSPQFHTAIANARPCVRPIENDGRGRRAAMETRSNSCSSSQSPEDLSQHACSDDDADLTSRVLAALDELPSPIPSSSPSLSSCTDAVSGTQAPDDVRSAKLLLSPEDSERIALLRSPENAPSPGTINAAT